jgi:hypothetical protein
VTNHSPEAIATIRTPRRGSTRCRRATKIILHFKIGILGFPRDVCDVRETIRGPLFIACARSGSSEIRKEIYSEDVANECDLQQRLLLKTVRWRH